MFKSMAIALVHHPVLDRRGDVVTSAVTNLDIHDLARLSTTYNVARFYLVTPAQEQQLLTSRIIKHWQEGLGASYNPDRRQALDCLQVKDSFDEAMDDWRHLNQGAGQAILTGARHQGGIGFSEARRLAGEQPVMLVFGTGHGLAPALYSSDRPCLMPVRADQYNHLSVRTAAAIILDRLVGEKGVLPDLRSSK
jgi:hypothetical protein